MDRGEARREPFGWAGSVESYLAAPPGVVLNALTRHLVRLMGILPSGSQLDAWRQEDEILRRSLRDLAIPRSDSVGWGITLEYELHLEGGRRPDVVLHNGTQLFVLEFKRSAVVTPGAREQVEAYARDLAEYHKASHDLEVNPVLVLTEIDRVVEGSEGVDVIGPRQLAPLLERRAHRRVDFIFEAWLSSTYEPLPTLIEAARMIFNHEPLPRIKAAESNGIDDAVALLSRLCKEAERDSRRVLALLAGVPGAGKTLTGLQLVYDRLGDTHDAGFLSGNGPLVEVLRDALKSKTFVQDLHAFVTTYGRSTRIPEHHIIVFDEAQRAWDRGYMEHQGRGDNSEPDVLIQVGERIDRWCSLVGLVGDGQEIHSGEEAGIGQWNDAITGHARQKWRICAPPRLSGVFDAAEPEEYEELDLTRSMRSRRAEDLHEWVARILDGDLVEAAHIAPTIHGEGFMMYLTRDLDAARTFLVDRYSDDPGSRYGILASSKSQRFLPGFGIDSSWPATKKVKYGAWYNRPRGEVGSGCNLEDVVTEFGCQGLELDFPLVAWSDDMTWTGHAWRVKPGRPRYKQDDPMQLRLNCYRVLLTRGRDGFLAYVPPDPTLDQTAHALLAAGVQLLPAT